MPQTRRSWHGFATRLFCAMLACVILYGVLFTGVLAASDDTATQNDTGALTSTTVPELPDANGTASLSADNVKNLAEIIAAATVSDSKAEDKRTPRDKLTSAYLAADLDAARAAIKEANDAQKSPLTIDYDALTLTDVAALITQMKTVVELEPAGGFFETIKKAAGAILNWMTNVLGGGNYIIGLIIFSLIVELAMIPLSIKQQRNSIKQASLRPKEMAIRKKYAGRDDQVTKNKINTEIQELYQKEGFNPASGCLPLLIQFPIIIILYNVVINPLVYCMKLSGGVSDALVTFANASVGAGGLGENVVSSRGTIEIASLISKYGEEFFSKLANFQYFTNGASVAEAVSGATLPNFNFFGLNLGLVPDILHPDWLLIIPVLTFFVYFGSMKISRKMTYQPSGADQATGCSNNIMDIGMPLFSVYICFVVPAALGLYWMIKSVISTVIRLILSKVMPIPVFTEEDYKAAEKELRGSRSASYSSSNANRVSSNGKPVRSLHHIDDEDFDDTRDKALARKAAAEEAERRAAEEAAAKMAAGGVKNEDDRPMLSFGEMLGLKKKKKNADKTSESEKPKDAAAPEVSPEGKKKDSDKENDK